MSLTSRTAEFMFRQLICFHLRLILNTQTLLAHNNEDMSQSVRTSELIINLELGTRVNVLDTCRCSQTKLFFSEELM